MSALSSSRKSIKTATTIIGLHLYLIVEDICAGLRSRYTVYVVSLKSDKRARIIGRELPIREVRALIKRREARS